MAEDPVTGAMERAKSRLLSEKIISKGPNGAYSWNAIVRLPSGGFRWLFHSWLGPLAYLSYDPSGASSPDAPDALVCRTPSELEDAIMFAAAHPEELGLTETFPRCAASEDVLDRQKIEQYDEEADYSADSED